MTIQEQAALMKLDSSKMAATTSEKRNSALKAIIAALLSNKEAILAANKKDLDEAGKSHVDVPVLKRLKFNEDKLNDVIRGIEDLISLPDPLGSVQMKRDLDSDLLLIRESCPIGVIGVIFEARPDAMIQISTLCIKSGNCAILKGGSETLYTNREIFQTIYQAVIDSGLPKNCIFQAEARSEISELLSCHDSVDLLIPRGSNSFVQYIMNHTKIPVMGHADGICHIYADKDLDVEKAVKIIIDSKTQYTAVCNAAVQQIISCNNATEEDFKTEYLDFIISVKIVDDLEEAIVHINRYGSHHTDCIITENTATAEKFMQYVDSAGVYQNCSTRFADGYRYGFGAEVGISTGKLHARGPVGLEGLCTYKYKLFGNGNIVADYAEGRKSFHFKDLI